jgi:hypothetical protein
MMDYRRQERRAISPSQSGALAVNSIAAQETVGQRSET